MPSDEANGVEEEVAGVLAESLRAGEIDDEHEVQIILAKARRQVVVRDLLTFSFVRVWTTLLTVTIEMYVRLRPRNEQEDLPPDEDR